MRFSSRAQALMGWFGIDRGAAALLAVLYEAGGEAISRPELARRAGLSGDASVKGRVSELRTILATEALDTHRGGYALTEIGLAEVREALRTVAAELLGESWPTVAIAGSAIGETVRLVA